MPASTLWRVSVSAPGSAEELVSALLDTTFGQPASSYTPAESGLATVSVYLRKKPARWASQRMRLREGLDQLFADAGRRSLSRIVLRRLRRQDWAESWKRHFRPIVIGGALLIQPGWTHRRPRPGQASIILDPGLSFGTGQHPTTLYCLRQVATAATCARGRSFLDLGTGSGILAIAAAKLGFAPIDALDLDPESIRVARANAHRNRVAHRIEFTQGDVANLSSPPAKRYSLVCANLITPVLVGFRKAIVERLVPGGTLVLAGILGRDFALVRRAYESAGLRLIHSQARREWRSGSFERPEKSFE